jgi:hypothetical protein
VLEIASLNACASVRAASKGPNSSIAYSTTFFACRACHGLAYRTENLTPLWRKKERLVKFQRQAGIGVSRYLRPMPAKAKWLRRHGYLNLRRRKPTTISPQHGWDPGTAPCFVGESLSNLTSSLPACFR